MTSLELIAIFITPIIGVAIMNERFMYKVKELIISYLEFLVITNLINNIVLFIFKDYLVYMFTISFFVKYTLLSIAITIIYALLRIILKENTKLTMRQK